MTDLPAPKAAPQQARRRRRPHPRAWLTALVGGRRLLERLARLEREQKRTHKDLSRARKKLRGTRKKLRKTRTKVRRMRQRERAARATRAVMAAQINDLRTRVHALEGKGRDHDHRLGQQRNLINEQVMAYELHLVESMANLRDLNALRDDQAGRA